MMIEIAILGHGVVGSGVVEVLATHKDSILKRAQNEINIKYILDLKEFPDSPFADRFTKNFEDIIQDDDVKIVQKDGSKGSRVQFKEILGVGVQFNF